jgi:hypothetical protein
MANTRKRSSRKNRQQRRAPGERRARRPNEELDAAGEARRAKVMATPEVTVEPYAPKRSELKSANFDHEGAEAKREAERAAQREEHNRRVGDASR